MIWCGFFTVHMLLLNVLSNSTISFYSHPRLSPTPLSPISGRLPLSINEISTEPPLLLTDDRWNKECGLSLIPLFLFILFQPIFFVKVFWSGTVAKKSLHVKSLSTSFDSIEIPTKFYGSPQTLFSVWSSMVLPDLCENTWYILASGKFFLIPSFIIIIKTRFRKKARCYPMGDKRRHIL